LSSRKRELEESNGSGSGLGLKGALGGAGGAVSEAGTPAAKLPPNWRSVRSKSRPGQVSYLHVPTGLKQSGWPCKEPSDKEIAAHWVASRHTRTGTAPLLKHAPAKSWRDFQKKQKRK
jgi:hypothetical protein